MLPWEPDPDWYLDHVVVPSGPDRRPIGPALAWEGSWQAEVNALARCAAHPALRRVLNLASGQGFVLTRGQARACGLPDRAVRRLVRRREWRVCGYGTPSVVAAPVAARRAARVTAPLPAPDAAASADAARRRHALAAAGGALRHPGRVVSGQSAAVLHGLPLLSVPKVVELTAAEPATPGLRRQVLVRPATLPQNEITDWFGAAVTTPARTVVDLARHDRGDGLMAADAALREQLTSRPELESVLARCRGGPGSGRLATSSRSHHRWPSPRWSHSPASRCMTRASRSPNFRS